ncbi:MAG: DnaJ domain-containing protein [Spirochaetes bacterium]|nr:DnaJ domain-containing protein [Spirochaetota bacterium]
MNRIDYYSTLGVGIDATEAEIKKAFRGLALKFHPDRNPGDPEAETRFKEIASAYDVLADPSSRRAYDLSHAAGHPFASDIFDRHGGPGRPACGRGRGCRGKRGFGKRAAFGSACVVELSPEEARIGVEKEFVMKGHSGYSILSVDIPPGVENGTVLRVSVPEHDASSGGFDIHIQII